MAGALLTLFLIFRWARVVSVTIWALNNSVFAVRDQFGSLFFAYSASRVHGLFFGIIVAADALGIFALEVPPSIRVGDNMVFFSWHGRYPLCALGQQVLQPSASE